MATIFSEENINMSESSNNELLESIKQLKHDLWDLQGKKKKQTKEYKK